MFAAAARLTVVAAAATLAGTASAHSSGIGFTYIPRHVVQGDDARVSVLVRPTGTRCTLAVRYQGGTPQRGLPAATATHGRVTWTWSVPSTVQAGPAQATVHCGRAGTTSRRLVIVGRLVEPKIEVLKSGYSIRPGATSGSRISYGLILHNDSPNRDAQDVSVQINYVLADNNLLGTSTARVPSVAAGSDYALGGQATFPGTAPVARLEVVVQVGKYVPHETHAATLANIHLVPGRFDPSWVGSIEGELQNTDPLMTLRSATLSAVVLDAQGNIVGGGSGFAFQKLPAGAREFVKLSGGLDAIPWEHAASTIVSATTSWQQPGA